MKKLYIVRHGETTWNIEGKTQGVQDSKLTNKGFLQAKLLGERLLKENIEVIYSSNLLRAKSTTSIISNIIKVPYSYESSLGEMNFGDWEGLTISQIKSKYPLAFKKWQDAPQRAYIPKGERLKQAQDRAVNFIKRNLYNSKEDNVLIISHSTIIKLILLHVLNMDLCNYYKLKQDNCSINIVDFRDYGPVLIKYNDTCYMDTVKEGEENKKLLHR
ncbi:MAG: histidine phosphatase family protein [Clostridiaceae bacterium]|nr:histidine phosphatase family protein [Clostridiaceae bacterium]